VVRTGASNVARFFGFDGSGDDVVELALTAMGLYQGRRALDVSYMFLDFGDRVEQRFVIEGQLNL
jgi:hypothetical protein